jgi:DNA (cytosine-5)-methyltransferase 1
VASRLRPRLTLPRSKQLTVSSASPTSTRRPPPAVPHHRGTNLRLQRRAEAPDPGDLAAVRRWLAGVEAPTVVDLFAGAGGLSLGLESAGFAVLVGADNDPFAVETHTANMGGLGYVGDLTDPEDFIDHLDGWGVETVDLVAGGVPCQPFSRAGQSRIRELVATGMRSEDDPRAALWRSFITIVERLSPRAVLIENVPDLPSWNDGAVLIAFFESLQDLGYTVDARVVDCFAHGVPQHRARLFIIGTREATPFTWPAPSGKATTLRDAIGDLPPVPGGQRAEELPYRRPREQLSAFQRRMRAGLRGRAREVIHDHITRAVRDDDMQAYQLLGEGQTYADLPERLQRYRSDIFTDKYKRLVWADLSRTITAHLAKDGYWYIHPSQHRTLSVREAARIQTFPDHFRFAGPPSHRYRQIGNAVPPMMAEALGGAIHAHLAQPVSRRFKHSSARDDRWVRRELLAWHAQHRRDFPWRSADLDPWHVLMAEMCLHRTRADQVTPVFEALLRLAPTPEAMLENSDEALQIMRALGLRWRAENLVLVAETLIDLFDGDVPDDDLGLRMLPGVGDYVAQAVLCFAFDRRAVLLDTNTMRIVSRLDARDSTRRWQLRLDLYQLAGSAGPDAEFNYALLDLGALVCRAGKPRCDECPLRDTCATGAGVEPPAELTAAEGA